MNERKPRQTASAAWRGNANGAKRERDALRRAALGGRRFNMDMYQGNG
ncbi:hypothetical protein [Pseudomonas aeruginosa]|nr:hypothetical protein [Pseudomonas aeruginosa]